MINDIRTADLDWHREKVVAAPLRGNRVLVSYAINKNESYGMVRNMSKSRCVWPTSLMSTDSKYLSRRIQAKA